MRTTFLLLALPLVSGFAPSHPERNPLTKVSMAASPRPESSAKTLFATGLLSLFLMAPAAFAVSGGGMDYANLDITGQDFSNGNYKGKDFTQVIAKGTNFRNSNLQGARFFKAYLVNADFTGADVRGASFEDTSMDGVSLKDTNAQGAYFSASILDVADLENVDLSDSLWPSKLQVMICDRLDLKGTNPSTGNDSRDSILCP